MARIKGQNLRVVLDGMVISAAQTCTVSARARMSDVSSKDDTDAFARNAPVDISWSVTSESAVWTGSGSGKSTADLIAYRGQTVDVELTLCDGEQNAEQGDTLLSGRAKVTDIRVTAQNRERGTCTLTLTGSGPLNIPLYLCDSDDKVLVTSDGKALTVVSA